MIDHYLSTIFNRVFRLGECTYQIYGFVLKRMLSGSTVHSLLLLGFIDTEIGNPVQAVARYV